jgi:hypothetical protein
MEQNDVSEEVRQLEESLWRTETRYNAEFMERVLAKGFFEFGQSGKIWSRKDMFPNEDVIHPINATIPLPSFQLRKLSEIIILVTYVSECRHEEEISRANRSSIWCWEADRWKLQFHQGTPCQS